MTALSALVFTLSGWLGLYLLARDPRKPVLALAAVGLCGFALVVALDAVRTAGVTHSHLLSQVEIYLVAVPSVAWFAVLLELSHPRESWRARTGELLLVGGVAAVTLFGAMLAGSVDGPLRTGHWLMFAAISLSTLGAMVVAVLRPAQPTSVAGVVVVATLFFALANAILIIPLGLVPSRLALASTGFDVLALGVAVALWDAFDEGQALRADMLRSFIGCSAVAALFGVQALIGLAVTRDDPGAQITLTVLLFTSLAIAITVQVLADPLAGVLDRLAFSRSPTLRADRAALRHTGAALPLRSADPLVDVDDDTFARLTRRALGHYADLTKLVASPLTSLPVIDERLAARGAPDHPLERANELKAVLADGISRLKPRDGGDFGTTERGATTTRCISHTSSVCVHMRRTRPPPVWIRPPGGPGSGWSPRSHSARCTTGKTPRPGSSPPTCAAESPSPAISRAAKKVGPSDTSLATNTWCAASGVRNMPIPDSARGTYVFVDDSVRKSRAVNRSGQRSNRSTAPQHDARSRSDDGTGHRCLGGSGDRRRGRPRHCRRSC